MGKEDMAARLRKLLGLDIRFERLTAKELAQLLEKVEGLVEGKAEQEPQEINIFPFGIIPAVTQRVYQRVEKLAGQIPVLRQDIINKVDAAIDEVIKKLVSTNEQKEKG